MLEKVRKLEFCLEKQISKDILSAIKVIVPLISLIRELEKAEEDFRQYSQMIAENNEKVKRMQAVIEISDSEHIKNILMSECEKIKEMDDEYSLKRKELFDIRSHYEKELISYKKYARKFFWATAEDFKIVLDSNNLSRDEQIALIFIIFNNNNKPISLNECNQLIKAFNGSIQDIDSVFILGWNRMLELLKEGKV